MESQPQNPELNPFTHAEFRKDPENFHPGIIEKNIDLPFLSFIPGTVLAIFSAVGSPVRRPIRVVILPYLRTARIKVTRIMVDCILGQY